VRTGTRYALYQIPGILICALLLAIVWRLTLWPTSWALGALALWVVKDMALYPLVRDAYEHSSIDHGAGVIGLTAVVVDPLAPNGRVRVRGELWRATHICDVSLPAGTEVRIEARDGLCLSVRPVVGHSED
jgi:membrane protein implicated in regulation of membrane protease activity